MKIVSQEFKDALKGVKELIGVVSYKSVTGDVYNVLSTEGGSLLTTEAGKLIGTEKSIVNVSNEDINSINISYDGKLLKTICKSVQIELNSDIELNSKINIKIGVMVDDEYEYVDYGYFYNIQPSEYQLDNHAYVVTAYDRMYKIMKKYDDDPLDVFPISHKDLLTTILDKYEIEYELSSYDNEDVMIYKDYWLGEDVTYRDIVDELCTSGGFGGLIINNKFVNRIYNSTEETIDEENMQSSNVAIGDKFGPINLVEISDTNDVNYIIGRDNESIEEDGLTRINLGVNRILANDIDGDMYEAVFNAIAGMEFYLYDLATYGLLMFEPLDMFSIDYNENLYPTILLSDSITLTTGIKEDILLEKPEETVDEYTTSDIDDEKIKNAIINVDKANAQIVLKVNSDGKVAQVALNGDADNGSEISFDADQINFDAYEFNLSTTNLAITSDNVDITNAGINLKNGAVIANENGLLSMFQYNGDQGLADLGWSYWDQENLSKHPLVIYYSIPNDFTIVDAYVVLTHSPTSTYNYITGNYVTGYARNIKLYQANNLANEVFVRSGLGLEPDYTQLSMSQLSWQEGTWSSEGKTFSSTGVEMVKTGDISSYIRGEGMLLAMTDEARPTDTVAYQKTGLATIQLVVIGYYPFTR